MDILFDIATYIGIAIMICGGVIAILYCLIGIAMLSNWAQHAWLESIGGWEVFLEYRAWYQQSKAEAEQKRVSPNEIDPPDTKKGG
jgi:hypothetical protein